MRNLFVNNHSVPRRAALALLLVLSSVGACVVAEDAGSERPEGVPASAEWVGGADGGVWVDLQATSERGEFDAAILADVTGASLYQGTLALTDPQADDDVASLRQKLNAWDGSQLLLTDGRSLSARK